MVRHRIRSLYKKSIFLACAAYCLAAGTLAAYAEPVQEVEGGSGIDWSQNGLKIVLVAAAVYILARAFSRRRRSDVNRPQDPQRSGSDNNLFQSSSGTGRAADDDVFGGKEQQSAPRASRRERQAQAAWGGLMGGGTSRETSGALATQNSVNQGPMESGNPEEEFMRGAKLLYSRIYEDMDNNDLDDIRNFATERGISQIKEIMARRENQGTTDLRLVNGEILRLGATEAAVRFKTLMRRPGQTDPREVSETWRFTRPDPNRTWMVDSFE